MTLTEYLRQLRIEAGDPSTRAIAHRTTLSHTTVADAFKGERTPSWRTVLRLLHAMRCDTDAEVKAQRLWLAETVSTKEKVLNSRLVKVGKHWVDPEEVAAVRADSSRAAVIVLKISGAELKCFQTDADAVIDALKKGSVR